MPMIRGRYYANPAYGQAMERAGESAGEWDREEAGAPGEVHHVHIQRHAGGVRVQVHRQGPGNDARDAAPSGEWSTHNFEPGDHEGVGRFVTSVLARGEGKPTGKPPFARS